MEKELQEQFKKVLSDNVGNFWAGTDNIISFIDQNFIGKEGVNNYKNEAGEACVALNKILSLKQEKDITEDEVSFMKLNLENKRRQDEANYVNSLLSKIDKLEAELLKLLK